MDELCAIKDILRTINDFETDFYKQYKININEAMLLCCISKPKQCASGDIAGTLGISSSNASKIIFSAENKGLILRIIGKEDKRKMYFELSDNGKKLLDSVKSNSTEIQKVIDKIKQL